MHDDSPRARAALARGADRAEYDARQRDVHVGVWRDDDGVVAAEFEQRLTQSLSDDFRDAPAHAAGSRRGHQWNAGVVEEPLTDARTVTHSQSEYRWIHIVFGTYFGDDLRDGDRCERGALGRLP